MTRLGLVGAAPAALALWATAAAQSSGAPRIYNTAKQKLERGEQIVGGTVTLPDPERRCRAGGALRSRSESPG